MQCSRCKYEFCWLCLGPFFGYLHEKNGFACPYRYIAVVGVMIALFVMSTVKVGYMWDFLGVHIFNFYNALGDCFLIDIQTLAFFLLGLTLYDSLKNMHDNI
jgi:hypothetical protein